MSNSKGTYSGKLTTVGKRTVKTGTARIKFDDCCFNSNKTSFVLNIIAMHEMKRNHSRALLVKLAMSTPKPIMSTDAGQSNCVSPVMKSPKMICWISAKK